MSAPQQDRRAASVEDTNWRQHVDKRLTTQDGVLKAIDEKLDSHIAFAKAGFAKTEPVVEAMEGMKTGIKVIGWIGSKAAVVGAFLAAMVGAWFTIKDHFK